jgi:hypothetical protein
MHSISLDAVIKSEYPAIIRLVAEKLRAVDYLNVGTFLKELTNADLVELLRYCNAITEKKDHDDALDCIVLLAEMLAQAEGAPVDTTDINRIANLMILLTFEDMARQNIIEFSRENATLCENLFELNIAKLK